MPRLFTGLEIPADIGQTLSSLRGGLPGTRWIDPQNYHVTLRFIGDIDGAAAREISHTLERINRKPFEVALQGLSSFGGKKPRKRAAPLATTAQPLRGDDGTMCGLAEQQAYASDQFAACNLARGGAVKKAS